MASFDLDTSTTYSYKSDSGTITKKRVSRVFDGVQAKAQLNAGVAFAVNDVVQILAASYVPSGCQIEGVAYEVLTVEGSACTFALGDVADATGYFGGSTVINGNTLAKGFSFVNATGSNAYGKGKFSNGENCPINLKLISGTMNNLKVKVTPVFYTNLTQAAEAGLLTASL